MTTIIGKPLPNMPWQKRPTDNHDVVWRYQANPIINHDHIPSSNSIFNSAVVPYKDGFAGVFRCDSKTRQMQLHSGKSADGIHWELVNDRLEFRPHDNKTAEISNFEYAYDPRVIWPRRSLLRDMVQWLSWPHHWCRVHARFRDLLPNGKRLLALQPQRRFIPTQNQRQIRHAQPPKRQWTHPIWRYLS